MPFLDALWCSVVIRIRQDDVKSVCRCRAKVNIGGWLGAASIEGNSEYLADIARFHLQLGGRVDELALRRRTGHGKRHDLGRCAVEIDEELVERIHARRKRDIGGLDA